MKTHLLCVLFSFLIVATVTQSATYNKSLCTDIEIDQLHYYINSNQNSQDIQYQSNDTTVMYNLCSQVEVYCSYLNAVLVASLVVQNQTSKTCSPFIQTNITFINPLNGSQGIQVTYTPIWNQANIQPILLTYPCNSGNSVGCPSIESSIMWEYFNRHLLAYTIVIQVIGVILMILGIYIYRGSIVLIGWSTAFIILVIIQSLFVFLPGVPDSLLQNILILTIICSFFVGYILGYFPKAGVFSMGLWIGFVIALTLNNIAFYYINSTPSNLMLYIVLPVLSIGFGILILFIKRTFIIFASSLIGSYLCLRALSWHLGAFPNEFQLSLKYHLGLSPPVPWQFYLYVLALMILTASASALQTWLFKKKMRKTNQNENIEDHLDKMQNTLKKQREDLMEFQNIFKPKSIEKPRVLNRYDGRHTNERHAKYKKEESEEEEIEEQQNYGHERISYEEEELPAYVDSASEHNQQQNEKPDKGLNQKLLQDKRSKK